MIRTFSKLRPAERRLLAEALWLLPQAAAAIRFRPFPKTVGFGAVALGPLSAAELRDVLWAVDAAARRLPFRTMCFEQGLTVQRMLRSRGQDARLHYGIVPGDRLEAHVWVSLGERTVLGGEEAARFREVGRWP